MHPHRTTDVIACRTTDVIKLGLLLSQSTKDSVKDLVPFYTDATHSHALQQSSCCSMASDAAPTYICGSRKDCSSVAPLAPLAHSRSQAEESYPHLLSPHDFLVKFQMAAVPVSSAMPGMGRLAALRGLQRGVSSHSRLCRRHLSGRATASATREYCERTNVPLSAVLEPAGWEIGAVGAWELCRDRCSCLPSPVMLVRLPWCEILM